ncbi:MAG TPA: DUF2829 domain-containing protein, partial [Gammaproteobacteria bacterium]|nr:DUF2829 domain-containing protein [Gammaproteobacteria bacterium]
PRAARRGTPVCMDFAWALGKLREGERVARAGWNGKGMWIGLVRGGEWTFTNGRWDNYPCRDFIAMKTVDEQVVPWLASQTDILADDWVAAA